MINSSMPLVGRKPAVRELVINWHITEGCNFKCRYCYAHWDRPGRELIHSHTDSRALLRSLFEFFRPENVSNPLSREMTWEGLRLNLAGGEPLLYPERVRSILKSARQLGFSTSIISNGSLLSNELAEELAPDLSLIGISLDSTETQTNLLIGRSDSRGKLVNQTELEQALNVAKKTNPSIELKINTVVNSQNVHEDFSALIQRLAPTRWKVLRVLPVLTQALGVSTADFARFLARHQHFSAVISAEDNADMSQSYLMIDPLGRFFQNAVCDRGYHYSRPILQAGASDAFSDITVDPTKFAQRYQNPRKEAVR